MRCPYCRYNAQENNEDLGDHLVLAHSMEFAPETAKGVPLEIIEYSRISLAINILREAKNQLVQGALNDPFRRQKGE